MSLFMPIPTSKLPMSGILRSVLHKLNDVHGMSSQLKPIAVFVVAPKPGSHDLVIIRRCDFEEPLGKLPDKKIATEIDNKLRLSDRKCNPRYHN
jgi:hypothetical protein